MPTYIDTTNLSPATIAQLQGPVISQIQITDNSYTVIDDTAVSTTGGYIKITGSNFTAGTQVVIGTVAATSVTYISSTTLNVQVPAQSAGSYVVYVTVSTGSVAILVNGLTYSGVPTWVTGSTLPDGQVGSSLSIQLSATGDAPVTYALAAGSSLPPGVTLTSGGLLSGTVTGITSQTIYNFTINAIDAQLQDSPRGFSVTITANDQYFKYVTSLLSASTPASTFVTDASTNSFAVTVNGDTRPSNFGPYTPGYYSNYFDGTGDYLTVPDNAAFEMAADFTVEAWFYGTVWSTWSDVVTKGAAGIYQPYYIAVNNGTLLFYSSSDGSSWNVASAVSFGTVSLNQWYHVAVSRQGTSLRLFLNGSLITTITNGSALYDNDRAVAIGGRSDGTELFTGYISNVRIVKGTAVYTAAFTPSTAPLTAIANTSLLTCQSNRFIDNSTNNFTITRNGDTLVSGFDPFVPNSSYTGYGAGYFDGTGDYLSVPDNEAFNFTGDFTIECWLYPTSHPTGVYLIGQSSSTDYAPVLLYLSNGRPGIGASSNGSSWTINSFVGTALTLNTWSHVAMVRSGNKWSIYVNGVENVIAASTAVTPYNSTDPLGIGGEAAGSLTYPYVGYMTDVRIVKGTAVYTTNFTPPATPLTAIANTSLLTLQNNQPNNNSMFLDSSTNNFNITRNGNTTQGSFSPYGGGWSNYFDGGTNRLTTGTSSQFNLTGASITLECWVYMTAAPSVVNRLITIGPNNAQSSLFLGIDTSRILIISVPFGSGGTVTSGSTALALNTWSHIAFVLNGSTGTLYLNGVQVGQTSGWNITSSNSNYFYVGYDSTATVDGKYTGYVSNVRLLVGTALYSGSSFTVPTSPLTPIVNTRILVCADNRFIDDSANNFAIGVTGSVTTQRFNPFNPVLTTPTSYSAYFDGNGDRISAPNINFSTNNFTIEGWFYYTGATIGSGTNTNLWGMSNGAGANPKLIAFLTTTNIYLFDNSEIINVAHGMVPNTWYHLAFVRTGTSANQCFIYRNGVALNSTSLALGTQSSVTAVFNVGYVGESYGTPFTGYISNFRVVNGTAIYTSNFTPSTTPLTAVANTSLLTLQSPTFVDNSTNGYAITASGDTAPRQFNPFGWTNTTGSSAAYTPALYGGSAYFDGTGDFLNAPTANNAFAYGSGNFTVEAWIYPTKYTATIIDNRPAGSATGLFLGLVAGGNVQVYSNVQILISPGTVPLNTWTHIALSRSSNTMYLYINGVMVTSASNSTNFTDNNLRIGEQGGGGQPFGGYITDVRITKGIACYTSNFQPPIAPLTALTNTTLLANMTGAGIYDSSMMVNYETVGNASINTAFKKYGSTSMYFDGTDDYVSSTTVQPVGSGDFTIECWAYSTGSVTNNGVWHFATTIFPGSQAGLAVAFYGSSGWQFYYNGNQTGGGGSAVLANTWYHLAVVRSGTNLRLYVNGTSVISVTDSTNYTGQALAIGGYYNTGYLMTGYIDDFRITRGVARYTTTFTPPASPFINF